jgi:hypothetical protein
LTVAVFTLLLVSGTFCATQITLSDDGKTMTIEDAPDQEVFSLGKTVVVKNRVKGVSAIGGDIHVEGNVSGDVATIGGTVYQSREASIGGDVIVIGGSYKPEIQTPLREAGKETVVFGVFENELRELAQDPTQIFSPNFTLTFLAGRLLSVLFWFVVTFGFATIAPGAVSRAAARIQLSSLKVVGIGMIVFILTLVAVIAGTQLLPDYLSVSIGLMAIVLMMLAYVFGRVALHLSVGKFLQKNLLPDGSRSETLAILLGVVFWTLLMSVPYLWTLAVLSLFVAGLGLVLTAKTTTAWRQS